MYILLCHNIKGLLHPVVLNIKGLIILHILFKPQQASQFHGSTSHNPHQATHVALVPRFHEAEQLLWYYSQGGPINPGVL